MVDSSWNLQCGKVTHINKTEFYSISQPARNAFNSQYRYLPLLNQVAMPFYLTHGQVIHYLKSPRISTCPSFQVLVAVLSCTLRIPLVSTFPCTLTLTTLATFLFSLLITKMGPIRCQDMIYKSQEIMLQVLVWVASPQKFLSARFYL